MKTLVTAHERITVPGPTLDVTRARALMRDAAARFERGVRLLLLDLTEVRFIDSLGVAALVQLTRAAPEGARVAAAGLSPAVQTIARVTFLHEVVDLYQSIADFERVVERAA